MTNIRTIDMLFLDGLLDVGRANFSTSLIGPSPGFSRRS